MTALEKAQKLGFTDLGFDTQWVVFNKARMFGWDGNIPGVLGNHIADIRVEEALDYLIEQGIQFRKDGVAHFVAMQEKK